MMIKPISTLLGLTAAATCTASYMMHIRKSPHIGLKSGDILTNKGGTIHQKGNRLVVTNRSKNDMQILETDGKWTICNTKYNDVSCVSSDGVTLIVGCPDAPRGKRHGRVLIYRKKKNSWSLFDELFPSHEEKDGCFGRVVRLFGDTLIVSGDTMCAVYKESNGRYYQTKYMIADGPYDVAHPGIFVCRKSIIDTKCRTLYTYKEFEGPRSIISDRKHGVILGWDFEKKVVMTNQVIYHDELGFGQSVSIRDDCMFVLSDYSIFVYSYLDEWQLVSSVTLPKILSAQYDKTMWHSQDKLYLSCPSVDSVYCWNIDTS